MVSTRAASSSWPCDRAAATRYGVLLRRRACENAYPKICAWQGEQQCQEAQLPGTGEETRYELSHFCPRSPVMPVEG